MKLHSQQYENYIESHNEWVDHLPSKWTEKRVKDLFRLVTDKAPDNNDYELLSLYTSIGVRPRKDLEARGNKASSTDGYWIVKKGDIVVNKLLAWMGAIGLSDYTGVASPAYDILRKLDYGIDERFFAYLFRTEKAQQIFKKSSRGIMDMRLRLYFDKFGAITVPVPPFVTQQTIAGYLDTKTAPIDRKIDLLTQKATQYSKLKQALINETVTRGLDKSVAMKDSGVEWIGEVPEHWDVELVKRSLRVLTDFTANGSFASLAENVAYMDRGYARLVRLTDLRHDLKNDGLYVGKNAYNFLSKTKIRGGEILIANVGAYTGLVKLVPQINFKATLGPNMFLAVFKDKLLSSFINYQLSSICCFEQFRIQMTTTAQPKLNKDNFRSISIVIPPLPEQQVIAEYLDTKTAHIDRIVETTNTQIDKLKELRKTLINDVVTGKIKVA